MGRSLEDFELLNTASQLRRAADHAFAFYGGAIPLEQCRSVTQESYDLLAASARVSAHLVPLAERWALDRLRRLGILDNRLTHAVPEVLFVDRHDSAAAPIAAALLAAYARGRVNVASAGQAPVHGVDAMAVRVMADTGIDLGSAFAKPLTDDALRAADVIVVLGQIDLPEGSGVSAMADRQRRLRWDVPDLRDQPFVTVRAGRDELDRRVLRLLVDLLPGDSASAG